MRTILVAHEADGIRQVVQDLLEAARYHVVVVAEGREAQRALTQRPAALVLDVGIGGVMAFELVDEARRRDPKIKIVLVASVHNRAGYKRRPTSLYGADDYVEQHHIADSLVGKLDRLLGTTAQVPRTLEQDAAAERRIRSAGEAHLGAPASTDAPDHQDWNVRAERLARVIVADVALYNADAIDAARRSGGDLSPRLRNDLEEGRLFFDFRVPKAVREKRDFLAEALQALIARSTEAVLTPPPQDAKLRPIEFTVIRRIIEEYCGIHFDEQSAYLLERRLRPRLNALHLRSFADYCDFLDTTPRPARTAELEQLVDHITTNETYFFRESYQLDAFRYEIVPELAARKRDRRLRIWSAGCSTGEEPYTIAILLEETGLVGSWDTRILGTDISGHVLDIARAGSYGPSSFRTTEPDIIARYFFEVEGRRQVREPIRQRVSLRRLNLNHPREVADVGPFDVIFCRNVLIYFAAAVRQRVVDSFSRQLLPGGYLLLGHSESLAFMKHSLELVRLRHDMVYRKPL